MPSQYIEIPEEEWEDEPTPLITQTWARLDDAKVAVKSMIVQQGESWKMPLISDKTRLRMECSKSTCPFLLTVGRQGGMFKIKKYIPYSCPPATHQGFKWQHSAKNVAHLLEPDIAANPDITPQEMSSRMAIYHGQTRTPYMPLYRARNIGRSKKWGDEALSYRKLYAYMRRILDIDEDESRVSYDCWNSGGIFRRLCIAPKSCRYGAQYIRPFVAFDGTHIRSAYNLTLMIAVGVDGEGHVLPLQWAIVPKENDDNWEYFLNEFKANYDEIIPWAEMVTISDRAKGLTNAVATVFPDVPHAMCCQHLAENVHKKFDKTSRTKFWAIARAKTRETFTRAVRDLKDHNPAAERYLDGIGYPNFAFQNFPRHRFGHDTSNIVEAVNSLWSEIRDFPPLQMLDHIWQWMMTEVFFKRVHIRPYSDNPVLTNMAFKAYTFRAKNSDSYTVQPADNENFLVTTPRGHRRRVSLPAVPWIEESWTFACGSCDCRMYEEYRSPCSHAIAAINFIGKDPFDYFHPCWTRRWLLKTYGVPMSVITIDNLKERSDLKPPYKVKKSGRPRKQRIRNGPREHKEQRRCGNCRKFGHYRPHCPNQPYEKHGKAQRARDNEVDEVDSLDEHSEFDAEEEEEEAIDVQSISSTPPSDSDSDLSSSVYEDADALSSDSANDADNSNKAPTDPAAKARFDHLIAHKQAQRAHKQRHAATKVTKKSLTGKNGGKSTTQTVLKNAEVAVKKTQRPVQARRINGKQPLKKKVRRRQYFNQEDHDLMTSKYEEIEKIAMEYAPYVFQKIADDVSPFTTAIP